MQEELMVMNTDGKSESVMSNLIAAVQSELELITPHENMNSVPNLNSTSNNKSLKRRRTSAQSLEELRKYFYLPIQSVSKELGICTTILKKLCRNNNIQKWPYRQIKSLTCAIQSLDMAMLNSSVTEVEKHSMQIQIRSLQASIDAIIADPSILSKLSVNCVSI